MDGLIEGREVHWVSDLNDKSKHMAATIVHVWGDNGTVNLFVPADGVVIGTGSLLRTSVMFDPNGAPGTWHWIEKA